MNLNQIEITNASKKKCAGGNIARGCLSEKKNILRKNLKLFCDSIRLQNLSVIFKIYKMRYLSILLAKDFSAKLKASRILRVFHDIP